MTATAALASVRTIEAGFSPHVVPYAAGLALQHQAVDRVRSGNDRGTLLLLEHEAVYTAGKRSTPDEYPRDGTPVVAVDRGGKVTWHGPGQLVAYPVFRLREKLRVVDFVRILEQVIIDVAAEFGVTGFRIEGRAGVWASGHTGTAESTATPGAVGDPPPAKFAQIGIHAADGIITHGIAINCCNDLAPFDNFVPCGITDAGVTTLTRLAGRTVTPEALAPALAERLSGAIEEVSA